MTRWSFADPPHRTTAHLMTLVLLACLPGVAAQVFYYGYGPLIQLTLAVITAVSSEALALRLRRRSFAALHDRTALVTAVLLAISLPPLAPWWLAVIGSVFAILLAKQVYGGTGQNIFNPAMVGFAVLLIAFPAAMTHWPASDVARQLTLADSWHTIAQGTLASPPSSAALADKVDGWTQATPLDHMKTALRYHVPSAADTAYVAQRINLAWLAGGLLLLALRVINGVLPCAFLVGLAICAGLSQAIAPAQSLPWLLQLSTGATMAGAFFILTDPVTVPVTQRGRWLAGLLAGALVWLIRQHGGYPDGVAFAVLFVNLCTPLIDRLWRPQ